MAVNGDKGVLLVISAFGGAGKGTIIKELVREKDNILSISATSRQMRPEDKEGVTYFFKTREEFENMIRKDELIEWVEFVGNYYGTPKGYIEEQIAKGKNVILELEEVGAIKIKELYKDAVLVFVLPPSIKELIQRLRNRGETEEYIAKRVKKSKEEVELIKHYDYVIVNDKLEDAVAAIQNVIRVANYKVLKNQEVIENIREELKNVTTII